MKILSTLVFVTVVCLLFLSSCDDDDKTEYLLNVAVEEGVTGTPGGGDYSYEEGTVVNYNYSLETGYTNLIVHLNGEIVSPSGSITMNQNHALAAEADPI